MPRRRFGPYTVETSDEDKLLFPGAGIGKGALIDHYLAVADALLPHLADRPLSLRRFPDGIEEDGFFQKQVGDHFPDWIERVTVDKQGGGRQALCVARNAATLAYLANQAAVELHPWLSRTDALRSPDLLVVDLDPPGDDFEDVRETAFLVRDLLEELGLVAFAKSTGSRGVHVVCPLSGDAGFDAVRQFARGVAEVLVERRPEALTVEQRVAKRGGRLYLDIGRNAYGQTAVAPWSVRAKPGAPVAMPLAWEELADRGVGPRTWTLRDVPGRLERDGDPWRGMGRRARGLAGPRAALAALAG